MTAVELGEWMVAYYGAWKEDVVKRAVWEYLKSKNERFCAAMKLCLEESRPPEWGPPSQKHLRDLHQDAVRKMDLLPVEMILPMIEAAPEERAGPEDVAALQKRIDELARRKQA